MIGRGIWVSGAAVAVAACKSGGDGAVDGPEASPAAVETASVEPSVMHEDTGRIGES